MLRWLLSLRVLSAFSNQGTRTRGQDRLSRLIEQAIGLEKAYRGMLLQIDEVNTRVQLWREVLVAMDGAVQMFDRVPCRICASLRVTIHSIGFDHHAAHVAISKYHLAEALGHRFFHRFTHSDLDEQIISCREALPWIKEFAEGQLLAALMFCLGVALRVRFRISPQLEDVEEGINCLSRAVELSPADPEYLAELGKLHLYRYGTCGNADDMLQAEKLADRAFQLRIGHPARGLICHFRADCMTLVNQNRGTIAEAGDELTNLYKESLCWRSLGHHSHFEGWDGLGIALCAKYWQTGDAKYMNSCIIYSRTACALVHPKHFQASRFLHNYATALQQRFNVSGNLEDLHQSIHWGKQAVAAAPVQRQSDLLAIIGNCMSLLALSTGDTDLMSEAINVRREALRSSSEPTRHWRLYDVGAELIGRGSWLGNEESITEGIHYVRQALEGFAVGGSRHEDCVRALSGGILQLHRIRGASEHLDEVISLLEQVNAHLSEEFRRPSFLLLLGRAYRARFSRTAESNDMQLALQVDERALGILQPSNDRLKYDALVSIAEDRGIICSNQLHVSSSDIESTVQQLRQASSDLRPGHPDHQAVCVALAKLQLLPNTSSSDYNGAMALLLHTLRGLTGNPYQAVTSIIAVLAEVEKRWVPLWSPTDPARGRLLDVYRAVIDLLPRLASLDSDPSHRVQVLGQTRDMAGRAASQAIALEDFTSAVELLEAGRAVFWTQLLRTRTSFDGLDPDVAAELRDTARRLENMTGTSVPLDLDDHAARDRMERMFNERRRLSKQFDELVQTVQTQPGMGGFLRNADYDQLSHAARRGPVVVLHSSWMTVIASPGAAPRVLALTKLNDQWMSEAMRVMRSAAKRGRMRIDSRGMRKRPAEESISPDADIQAVFAELWRQVAQPLLEFLKWPRTEGRNRPRLFICPTGMFTFLPVHAAGIYEGSAGTCLSDFCVVSYAPTLGALTRECNPVARQNTRLFLAAAPAPPTMHALPAAKREAELVTTIVPRTVLMANADATADDVIRLLADATILHLACHGKQNAGKPLESGFVMQDRMIQIADLIRLDLPKARLAFLSACETAQGDTARPDEALHLAAAMLFAGFKSVVGTLWSMDDVDGPVVAEAVYRELFAGNGEELDFDCVPYALDDAVRKLRERGYEVSRWATYVHIGM